MGSDLRQVFLRCQADARVCRNFTSCRERDFFIDNLLARIHFMIEMILWTSLAPWEFEFPPRGPDIPPQDHYRALRLVLL